MAGYPKFLWLGVVHGGLQVFMYRILLVNTCNGRLNSIIGAISMLRFGQVKGYIHPCHPDADNGRENVFSKLDPFLSHALDDSSKLWIPRFQVSLDEMIIINYGRWSDTVRIRTKLIGSSFQVCALCDSGYIFWRFSTFGHRPLATLQVVQRNPFALHCRRGQAVRKASA